MSHHLISIYRGVHGIFNCHIFNKDDFPICSQYFGHFRHINPLPPRSHQRSEWASVRCQCKTLSLVEAMPSSKDFMTSSEGDPWHENHGGKGWSIKHIKQCVSSARYIYIYNIHFDMGIMMFKPKFFSGGCPIFRQAIQCCVGIRVLSVIRIIIQIMMYLFCRVITIFITTTITKQTWNNDERWPPHSTKSHIDYVWPSCGWTPQGSPFETAEVGEHRLGQGGIFYDTPHILSAFQKVPQFIA